jgi:methionyl-tRNA formyltransferase
MNAIESARIAFAGTPDFAVPSLEALATAGAALGPVFTQPDRRAGRGRELTASPVKQAARRLGLSVLQPERFDDPAALRQYGDAPDLLVVVAYGLLLPQWVLDWPAVAAVNVHASLLPRWRGAAPIQHAILAGDSETGVSIMRMTRGLDRGPVYATRATPIGPRETGSSLHDRLAGLGAGLLVEVLPDILSRRLAPEPQDDAGASYAGKIEKRHAALDWSLPAVELERRVRAFNAWPVADARVDDGRRLRIWEAEAAEAEAAKAPVAGPAGAILTASATGIEVATGSGVLRLNRIQPPGGKVMSSAAYLAAHSLSGCRFVSS